MRPPNMTNGWGGSVFHRSMPKTTILICSRRPVVVCGIAAILRAERDSIVTAASEQGAAAAPLRTLLGHFA
jgi:hypothetical protein